MKSDSNPNDKFLKELTKEFYYKLINTDDFNEPFENNLCKWIENILEQIHKKAETYLEFMQDHEGISSLVGFFYQHGIGCNVDKDKALKMYLSTIKRDEPQSINTLIAKYLLALFYYKDIILDKRISNNYSNIKHIEHDTKEVIILQKKHCKNFNFKESKNESQEKILNVSTENEDSDALYLLGFKYQYGMEMNKDEKKAFEYYLKSAEKGNNKAQYCLGRFYEHGVVIDKDLKKAFEWYLKSAEGGNMYSINNMGNFYSKGIGTKKDEKEAFKWYLKSAEGENTNAFHILAGYYAKGIGTKKDEKKAFKWYLKSAKRNTHINAYYDLSECYAKGIGTEKNEKKAFEWFLKFSEERRSNYSYRRLAEYYENGIGIEKNEQKAYEFYLKSAEGGDSYSLDKLTEYHKNGMGSDQDKKKTFLYYLGSAKNGYHQDQYNVGKCYHYGIGIEADVDAAVDWYEKALYNYNGSINANNALNDLLLSGQISPYRIARIKTLLEFSRRRRGY